MVVFAADSLHQFALLVLTLRTLLLQFFLASLSDPFLPENLQPFFLDVLSLVEFLSD
jgi:hypothetical protein